MEASNFAQLLAAFVLAPLQVLAQGVAPTGERLGLKGYDPVAYFTDGKPQPARRSSSMRGMVLY